MVPDNTNTTNENPANPNKKKQDEVQLMPIMDTPPIVPEPPVMAKKADNSKKDAESESMYNTLTDIFKVQSTNGENIYIDMLSELQEALEPFRKLITARMEEKIAEGFGKLKDKAIELLGAAKDKIVEAVYPSAQANVASTPDLDSGQPEANAAAGQNPAASEKDSKESFASSVKEMRTLVSSLYDKADPADVAKVEGVFNKMLASVEPAATVTKGAEQEAPMANLSSMSNTDGGAFEGVSIKKMDAEKPATDNSVEDDLQNAPGLN